MAYLTKAEAIAASRSVWSTRSIAESEIKKAAGASPTATYDIFLSHAYEDADVVGGVKVLLQQQGLSVYIDWLEDPQADRTQVTPRTADLLRRRMQHCRHLVFATSKASASSKWMPWELGYFDGRRPGHVSILPIVEVPGSGFHGQEYLGLYPTFEQLNFRGLGVQFGRQTAPGEGETLAKVARA